MSSRRGVTGSLVEEAVVRGGVRHSDVDGKVTPSTRAGWAQGRITGQVRDRFPLTGVGGRTGEVETDLRFL